MSQVNSTPDARTGTPGSASVFFWGYLWDTFWIVFFFVTCGALFMIAGDSPERYLWLAVDGIVAIRFLLNPQEFLLLIRRNAIFISWAALACASSVWSVNPWLSLYHGMQLLLTMLAAILLCLHTNYTRVLVLIFIAMIAAGAVALLAVMNNVPHTVHIYGGGWRGGFPHKNLLGDGMTILIVTGLCLFFLGWRRLLVFCGLVFAVMMLALTTAATPIVGALVTLSPLPLALALRRSSLAFTFAVGVTIVAGTVAALYIELQRMDIFSDALAALGKDETLTGRTILWDFAIDAFQQRPLLGFGFKGYWQDPWSGAAELHRVIGQDLWFFHNNFLEVAVAFGIIGPILLILGLLVGLYRGVKLFLEAGEIGYLWPLMIVIEVIVLCFVQNPLVYNHSFWQFLFIVAVTMPLQSNFHARDMAVERNHTNASAATSIGALKWR